MDSPGLDADLLAQLPTAERVRALKRIIPRPKCKPSCAPPVTPAAATRVGKLTLTWTPEPGTGGPAAAAWCARCGR
jgi:hypothetical protein